MSYPKVSPKKIILLINDPHDKNVLILQYLVYTYIEPLGTSM